MGERKVIVFYGKKYKDYEFLSNFYPSKFTLHGVEFPTVEHYFQASKHEDSPTYAAKIIQASTPLEAKKLGAKRRLPSQRLALWDIQIRGTVMMEGLYAKFTQDKTLCKKLLDTGRAVLIEDSPTDKIWGGREGGQNLLGMCLMSVRERINKEISSIQHKTTKPEDVPDFVREIANETAVIEKLVEEDITTKVNT